MARSVGAAGDRGQLSTLRSAINLTPHHPVVAADAVTDTARLIREMPDDVPVVVFTASLLSYLDATARASFYAVGVSLREGDGREDDVLALADPYVGWIAPADADLHWSALQLVASRA